MTKPITPTSDQDDQEHQHDRTDQPAQTGNQPSQPSQSIKNKHLSMNPSNSGARNEEEGSSEEGSGRSSPFIREKHRRAHHPSDQDHQGHDDGNGNDDGDEGNNNRDNNNPHHPLSPKLRRLRSTGRKIQHGLSTSSSRSTGLPNDCYIGLAFRCLKTQEEVDKYKGSVRGESESVVRWEEGEELLVWTAVVSDGQCKGKRCKV
jgi:hypothetical protein